MRSIARSMPVETLIIAKKSKLIPHGQWGKFLTRCGVGERQAERYMRLAWLVAANPTSKSDLAELSIEQAIKLLSPPKPSKETPTCGQPPKHSKPDRPDFTGIGHHRCVDRQFAE